MEVVVAKRSLQLDTGYSTSLTLHAMTVLHMGKTLDEEISRSKHHECRHGLPLINRCRLEYPVGTC